MTAHVGWDSTYAMFCADHLDTATGKRHGHTWRVEIFWPAEPFRDARAQHAWLSELVSAWDCRLLEDILSVEFATNYAVASSVLMLGSPNITRVRVSREGRVPCACEVRRDA